MDGGRLHGQIFAPCKICIPHILVGHAGGTTPWMEEVEPRLEQRPRATQEQLPDAQERPRCGLTWATALLLYRRPLAGGMHQRQHPHRVPVDLIHQTITFMGYQLARA